MRHEWGVVALTVAALLAGACSGRGAGGPPPAGGPVPADSAASDTFARRLLAEMEAQRRADSIRRAAMPPDSLVAPPGVMPAPAPGPEHPPVPPQRCILDVTYAGSGAALMVMNPITRKYYTVTGGGIRGKCRGQDITIEADSAESYEDSQMHFLIGNVRYREPRVAIDAARATYFRLEERILLEHQVHAVMSDGAGTLDGERVEYWRAVGGLRDQPRIVATQRPTLRYSETDSLGRQQPPIVMRANVITGEGDSTFYGHGSVEMIRTDITATADSAVLDGARQFSRLMRQPVIQSRGDEPYTLRGVVIELHGGNRQVERVVALDSARAESRDFELEADTIDLRVASNRLQRAFAFGTTGAHATTGGQEVVADSMDIVMPDQRIRELRAIGKAWAESDPDSTRIRTDERDWIRGDTVVAQFDSVAMADSASQPRLRVLVASGSASAFYQIPGDSTSRERPGINYVRGRVIRLLFDDGTVQTVGVEEAAAGVYLEPVPDSTAAPRPPAPGGAPPPPPVRPPMSVRR